MIEFLCDYCGRKIKLRAFEGVPQNKIEEIMDMDPFPENWVKLLRAAKQKGEKFNIQQLKEILNKRIRPMGVQCIHCQRVKNLEDLVLTTQYVVRPYRHPDSLRGNIWMY